MDKTTNVATLPTNLKRFVIRDELGVAIEAYAARDRDHAIEQFCWPALMWPPYESSGWTCAEEPVS